MHNNQTPAVEIRPEVTMLSVLRHLNYKAWFAIAEFIDNSLQSYLANKNRLIELEGPDYQLQVDIRIDTAAPGLITITDNAGGISANEFPRAFKAAHVPIDRSGLSEFGMGMKSAACWFAESWSVRTKALGENVERTINIDVQKIIDNKTEYLNAEERVVSLNSHYTVVTMRGLHHIPHGRTLGKIKDHLASIYRVFLRDGSLSLKLNNELLSYESAKILIAKPYTSAGIPDPSPDSHEVEWRKEINLDFGKDQRVTGFVALRETGSTTLAGLALFRRNRLIQGSHDETYRPSPIFNQTNSYRYQRLFGELHIEGFEVSHTKDGFRWEQYEDIFLDCLKAAIEGPPLNLLAQAENYRSFPSKRAIEYQATKATQSVIQHIESEVGPLIIAAKEHPAEPIEIPKSLPICDLKASEQTVYVDDGNYKWEITIRTSIDPATDNWVSLSKEEVKNSNQHSNRSLCFELSLAHPFSIRFLGTHNENIELLLRISTAICIALILSQDLTGQPPETVLHHLNYLMRGALSSTTLRTKS